MANKYCNLDGSKKIKDEYQKINIGFDKVEEDVNNIDTRVNNIITTPAEGISAQEIIDARGGRPVLGKRFEDIETDIEDLEVDLAAHKADYASKKFGSRPYTSTSDMIIYLDNTNGNNNNDGLTQQTAIKTFTELQRRLPIFLGHTCTVKIVGKYAASYAGEPIYIDSVYGSGQLVIEGVNMNSNNCMEIQFIVRDITNILIKNLYVITSGSYGIRMNNCQGLVDNVNVVSTGQYGAGLFAERGSVVEIKNSTLSSTSSIMSDSMATILSTDNLGSSTYGLDARFGSTIIKNGTQPTGTTSNERVLTGGLIR